jgi:arginine decarboxylase
VFIVIEKESEVRLVIEAAASRWCPRSACACACPRWRREVGGHRWREVQVRSVRRAVAVGGRALPRCRPGPGHSPAALPHGSQIANLADYQHGFKEAIRYYGELRNLGLPVDHIDVGGGLGVDYDGTLAQRQFDQLRHGRLRRCGGGMLKEFCDAQACRTRTSSPRAAVR